MKISEGCRLFIDHCRIDRGLAEHSLRAYQIDLAIFLNFIESRCEPGATLKLFRSNYLQGFIAYLRDDRRNKQSTIKRRLACIKLMFRWFKRQDYIPASPFDEIELIIKLPKRLPRSLTAHELFGLIRAPARQLGIWESNDYDPIKIVNQLSSKMFNQLNALIVIEILFLTGIRVAELAAITIDDIDLKEEIILIHGKGDRERQVFISEENVKRLIAIYLTQRSRLANGSKKFLVNSRGAPANTQFVRKLLRKTGESAELSRRVTPHMLRHSCATHLLDSGVDIRFVQFLLGHQSIATTQIYTQVSNVSLRAAISRAGARGRALGKKDG